MAFLIGIQVITIQFKDKYGETAFLADRTLVKRHRLALGADDSFKHPRLYYFFFQKSSAKQIWYNLEIVQEWPMPLDGEDQTFVREAQKMAWTDVALNSMLWNYAQSKMAEEGVNCSSCVTEFYRQLQNVAFSDRSPA
jgi:hypothetical protein